MFQQLSRVIWARRALPAGGLVLAAVAVAAYSAASSPQYAARATVMMDPRALQGLIAGAGESALRGASPAELAHDLRVARRVAERLGLASDPAALAALGAGSVNLHARVAAAVDVREERNGLFAVVAVAADPALSARLANAFAEALGDVDAEARATAVAQNLERAAGLVAQLRTRIERTEARVAAQAQGLDPGFDAAQALVTLSRIAGVSRSLSPAGEASAGSFGATASGPEAAAGAGGAWGGQAPSFLSALAELDLNDGTAVAPERAAPNWSPERSRPAVPVERLRHEAAMARQSLELAQQRLALLNAQTVVPAPTIAVMTPARPPTEPVSWPLWLRAGVALLLGLAGGIGAALLWERADRRVRAAADIAAFAGVAVFGSLPRSRAAGRTGGSRGGRRGTGGPGLARAPQPVTVP